MLAAVLDLAETDRARRYVFPRDGRRFSVARGALRTILAQYLGVAATSLRFVYGRQGKPSLPSDELRFNLSHSGDLALLAITRDREIGVDVEQRRRVEHALRIAEDFFSPQERSALAAVDDAERDDTFLRIWTSKEAYIKGIGEGLARPLDSFDVAVGSPNERALLSVAGHDDEVARWQLSPLDPHLDYIATLATEVVSPTSGRGAGSHQVFGFPADVAASLAK